MVSVDKYIDDMVETINSLFEYDPFDEDDDVNTNSLATRYYELFLIDKNIDLDNLDNNIIKTLNASVISNIDNNIIFEYKNCEISMEIFRCYSNPDELFYKVMLLKKNI